MRKHVLTLYSVQKVAKPGIGPFPKFIFSSFYFIEWTSANMRTYAGRYKLYTIAMEYKMAINKKNLKLYKYTKYSKWCVCFKLVCHCCMVI